MFSKGNLGMGLAVAAAMAASNGAGNDPLGSINRLYARTKKLKAPPKSKAVQKRRKANKQASKQRKSSK